MNAIIIIGFVVILLAMFIFWTAFRDWIGRQLNAIWTLITAFAPTAATWLVSIVKAIGVYSFILFCATVVSLVFMAIALWINSPGLTALTFVFAICLVLFTWMPAGILLRVFHITDGVVPKTLKMLVAWAAFVGFLGLMCPDVLTFKSLLGAALVGFIFLGITTKINALDKIVFPLVVVMCLWTAWGYFWSESFRSTTRYTESWAKRAQTTKDRGSINNETDAATTYGIVLRKISVAYTLSNKPKVNDVLIENEVSLEKGDTVKIASHKQEVRVIDGQGFVQITLAKENGSFVRGKKYWVEAEYVQLATPREVTPENNDLLKKQASAKTNPAQPKAETEKVLVLEKGVHTFMLKAGEKSPIIIVNGRYCAVSNNYDQFQLFYPKLKRAIPAWTSGSWPDINEFFIDSLRDQIVTITVT